MDRDQEGTIVAEQASEPYIGQWNRLISTANWEKGRIIHQWRTALREAGAVATEYSDESWGRLVGGVTGQHVGRLRRVFERFADVYAHYEGLYWSHFQAAIDWDDAEMWLEGALQNGWSVAVMRRQRWETMGAIAGDAPRADEIVSTELDEDYEPAERSTDRGHLLADRETVEARSPAGPDFGDEDAAEPQLDGSRELSRFADSAATRDEAGNVAQAVRPFADLQPLPEDLAAAFEAFQLAILHHKSQHWAEVSCDDVLASLDALQTLALAPA